MVTAQYIQYRRMKTDFSGGACQSKSGMEKNVFSIKKLVTGSQLKAWGSYCNEGPWKKSKSQKGQSIHRRSISPRGRGLWSRITGDPLVELVVTLCYEIPDLLKSDSGTLHP